MALRFRRSKRLFPGVTLNLGKRGGSVRIGGKGFGFTSGASGSRLSAGVPGTGISFSRKLRSNPAHSEDAAPQSRLRLWMILLILLLIGGLAYHAIG
ncbi:DUF4236 domain-containing protein [Pseudorhodoplanes sp.]|uniref:DUF4236 domain-containing protein n=1 Tax=Pseudorhodoplanes sp. TaxID=1934341 RepID=UPI003918ED19